MVKKVTKSKPASLLSPNRLEQAMVQRVMQRVACQGTLKLPAVPGLAPTYVELCRRVFAASGRGFRSDEAERARCVILAKLEEAFARSARSRVEISFQAGPGRPLGFVIEEDFASLTDAYERWIGTTDGPLFGAHPDARVLALVDGCEDRSAYPILDFGAGTGRNALALGGLGHPVDAVEITPKFADILAEAATKEQAGVRVVREDVFVSRGRLRRDYQLVVASEVAPDFRGVSELKKLFELASDVLVPGGRLVFSVHLCARGYSPEKAARELSQQCYSCLFTPSEVARAASGLPFVLVSNDSVCDFEKTHLPAPFWPPTPWYENWTCGLDVYETTRSDCPVEMRWLVFEKRDPGQSVVSLDEGRARAFNPVALRKAIENRLVRRLRASGTIVLPALPSMSPTYVAMAVALFQALGWTVSSEQTRELHHNFDQMLASAFAESPRANVVLTYQSPAGNHVRYTVTADPVPLPLAYEDWYQAMGEELFGEYPDARLLSLLPGVGDSAACPVLDIGAGLGRNAFYLARAGYPVDALEIVLGFVESLTRQAGLGSLPLRIFGRSLFEGADGLRSDYGVVLASGVAGDFRSVEQLRQLFQLAAGVLRPEGIMLLSLHMAAEGYPVQDVARQWAQHCAAMFYTPRELQQALEGLPLSLVDEEVAFEYEQTHLPADVWPPTPAFSEWATGTHLYAVNPEDSPVVLKWLVFRRRGG